MTVSVLTGAVKVVVNVVVVLMVVVAGGGVSVFKGVEVISLLTVIGIFRALIVVETL